MAQRKRPIATYRETREDGHHTYFWLGGDTVIHTLIDSMNVETEEALFLEEMDESVREHLLDLWSALT